MAAARPTPAVAVARYRSAFLESDHSSNRRTAPACRVCPVCRIWSGSCVPATHSATHTSSSCVRRARNFSAPTFSRAQISPAPPFIAPQSAQEPTLYCDRTSLNPDSLVPDLFVDKVEAIGVQKKLLLDHGFIEKDFDVEKFIARLPVFGNHAANRLLIAYVPRGARGVRDDWSGMGQRTTASGTAILKDVRVPPEWVIPHYKTYEGPQVFWGLWSDYPCRHRCRNRRGGARGHPRVRA